MAITLDSMTTAESPLGREQRLTFDNPIIKGFNPDPSICRVGDDYFLAVSSFEYFPGVPLYHSRDLVNWRPIGHALTRTSQLNMAGRPSSQGIFAPTLRYHDGLFYMITTDVGGAGNFLVTSRDPGGDWSEPVAIDRGCFDPSLFFDDDGKVYYTRRSLGRIVQAEIDVQSGKLTTPLRVIAEGFSSSDAEGPHLYKINGWYYLLCAEGGTGHGHMVTVGRSRSAWGPFESCPHNPILTHRHLVPHPIRYTGHGDLVQLQDGSWWMVFLGARHDQRYGYNFHVMGRETFLAPLHWHQGWPVVNEGKPIELSMPAPKDSAFVGAYSSQNKTFTLPAHVSEWSTLRGPLSSAECQMEADGALVLRGNRHTLNEPATPVFLARRQEDFTFRLSAKLSFKPTSFGEEAGLALRQSDDCHITLSIIRESSGLFLRVRRRILDMQVTMAKLPFDAGSCFLSISGDNTHYTLRAGSDPQNTIVLDRCPLRLLSTELATGWTGVTMGPYATGNGQDCRNSATFSEVAYQSDIAG